MDNIQIFTLGGTDRERHVINTVINNALVTEGYCGTRMSDHEGQRQEPLSNVGSVLDAMRDFDPTMLTKEVIVHSVPCMFTTADEATMAMGNATEVFENFGGGTMMLAGSGQDDEGELSLTGVIVIQDGPKTKRERLSLESIAKDVAKDALARADAAVRRQNIHLVKPEPPQEKKE